MDDGRARVALPRAEAPIGIFDSGMGGLAVLRELGRLLPHENVLSSAVGCARGRPSCWRQIRSRKAFSEEVRG